MTNRTLLLAVSLLLTAGAAAAQSLIVGGRQHQPTRQETESRMGLTGNAWNRRAQSQTDRLYDEIMRAAAPALQR